MRRKISIMAALVFISALALINHGCSGSGEAAKGVDDFVPDLNDSKLKERLAEDDGYAFAILYGSDIHGSLETCG